VLPARVISKPTPAYPPIAATRQLTSKSAAFDAVNQNKTQMAGAAGGVAHDENHSTQRSASQLPEHSENKVELDTLVQRVMLKRRRQRHSAERSGAESNRDAVKPAALPTHTRLHDAKIIQQRPVPASVVLPVSALSTATSRNSAVVLTQHRVRNSITDLVNAPITISKAGNLEPSQPRVTAGPTFFFDALEPRADDESEPGLTDRIDQVLREQARRQGVDLT
jgi:hypothetical protein